MDLNNILKLSTVAVVALAIGGVVGYTQAPDKIKIQEKIIEKVIKEKDEKVTRRYDPVTGKVIEEIKETKEKETNSTKTDKTTEKEKSQKLYSLKIGAAVNVRDLNGTITPRIGGDVKIPIFPVFIGVEGDISLNRPLLGIYGRIEF